MAKTIVLVASAFVFLAVASATEFEVKGSAYCDACQIGFRTPIDLVAKGADVQLRCYDRDTRVETFKTTAITNENGDYKLTVLGEHEKDICEISAVNNFDATCNVKNDKISKVLLSLTKNISMQSNISYANLIGFTPKTNEEPKCTNDLKEVGYYREGNNLLFEDGSTVNIRGS